MIRYTAEELQPSTAVIYADDGTRRLYQFCDGFAIEVKTLIKNCVECEHMELIECEDLQPIMECMRYPPNMEGHFPMVEKGQWCGEFKEAEK